MSGETLGRCSQCNRACWTGSEIGTTCGLTQPNGSKCAGIFRPLSTEVVPVCIQREGPSGGRHYIEVADVEGGMYRPDPDFRHMFVNEEMAGKAAEHALNRFPVARVCEEKMVYRRKEGE